MAARDLADLAPLRLDEHERSLLNVLDGALHISEYTDVVDVVTWRSAWSTRVDAELSKMMHSLSGLIVVASYKHGKAMVAERKIAANSDFFRQVFEVGRRHKILNPDKMRSTYGKLVYMLQDSASGSVRTSLGFDCAAPILTVRAELSRLDALALLDDADLPLAVRPLRPGESAADKRDAFARLVGRYQGASGGADAAARLTRCLLSLGDVEALIEGHTRPVVRMLEKLRAYFPKGSAEGAYGSLAIRAGHRGARLTHSHGTQYSYVEQSLLLWLAILSQLPRLWSLAEQDLLSGTDYRLRDTGQGYQRVQSAPSVGRFMSGELARLQKEVGGWVGSAAVHLGDHDVPNALVWLDKYTQIPRILAPIVSVIDELDDLAISTPGAADYINAAFGSVDACKGVILGDFFRHGFDGSGADNFYDAGSCIDGRLTSAWNWCSKLSKKSYYHVFMMAGFAGFDGSFSK